MLTSTIIKVYYSIFFSFQEQRKLLTMSTVQSQIQQDWNNREFVETITSSIKKISEFLNAFDLSARSRLAMLNQKLTHLERQVDYIEARISKT